LGADSQTKTAHIASFRCYDVLMAGWDVLERHFDGLTADDVDAELAAVSAQGATPTDAAATSYLAEHGGPDLDDAGDPAAPANDVHRRRVVTAARTLADTVRSTATLDQAANMLGLSRSRLSHRISAGTVWTVTVQGRRLVPRWQFSSDGLLLPGLDQIVAAIPDNLHPLAVDAFMTSPRSDFDDQSPAGWLASGGNPAVIACWLTGIGHG
jgi:hypothetical protein